MRTANLAVKFLLELAAFASLAVAGRHVGSAVTDIVVAVVLPAAAITVWALFCAPRSARRLPVRWRAPLELGIFALSDVAVAVAGHPTPALVLAVVAVVNAIGLTALRQWES